MKSMMILTTLAFLVAGCATVPSDGSTRLSGSVALGIADTETATIRIPGGVTILEFYGVFHSLDPFNLTIERIHGAEGCFGPIQPSDADMARICAFVHPGSPDADSEWKVGFDGKPGDMVNYTIEARWTYKSLKQIENDIEEK